jgi:sulfopyruvate decarboxylase subunit beta
MIRREAIEILAQERTNELVVTSVGETSRELHSVGHRETNLYHIQMSYSTPLGFGLALAIPSRKVVVLDGDGSMLMGLGGLATIARMAPKNLVIIVFDNKCYESCGAHPTATAVTADLEKIAKGAGIEKSVTVSTASEFRESVRHALKSDGPHFISASVKTDWPVKHPASPLPFDLTEGRYVFGRALVKEGLVESWHDVYGIQYADSGAKL